MQKKMLLKKIQHPIIFVQNTLAAVEEEKDPRNLMVSFDLIYFIISEYFSDHSPALGEDNKEMIEKLFNMVEKFTERIVQLENQNQQIEI